ncbi:MAG: glycogen-binding domain-containing protein [Kiritimatiellae bacterium]|nr:glycogen-binding domain-containing protein [Kiritimatiellia bacterium]
MNKKATRKCTVAKVAAPVKARAAKKTVAKKPVTFTFHAEKGKDVFLAGSFNGWDPAAKKMAFKARKNVYETSVNLAAGDYEYKFVVDGSWCADPENVNCVQNDQGTFNSVITVK